MLEMLMNIGTSALDLVEVRARLFVRDLERAGALILAYACAALLGVAGVLTLLGALLVWMAQVLGLAPALGILGASLIGVAGVAILVIRGRLDKSGRPSREELEQRVETLKETLADGGADSKDSSEDSQFASLAAAAFEKITKHPEAAAGGLFAIVSLFGPFRLIRMMGKASAAASVIAFASNLVDKAQAGMDADAQHSGADNKPRQDDPAPVDPGAANGVRAQPHADVSPERDRAREHASV